MKIIFICQQCEHIKKDDEDKCHGVVQDKDKKKKIMQIIITKLVLNEDGDIQDNKVIMNQYWIEIKREKIIKIISINYYQKKIQENKIMIKIVIICARYRKNKS